MARKELNIANLDHEGLKASLIDYLKSTEFSDFNYEGSAINTMVDLLTRNTTYDAFLANMLANESFITTAQVKANVNSHAEKLSHTPRSANASRTRGQILVIPADTSDLDSSIIMERGTTFLATIGGKSYSFVNKDSYILVLDNLTYKAEVDLYQGQLLTNIYSYSGIKYEIPNQRIDTTSLSVRVIENGTSTKFMHAKDIKQLSQSQAVYFISLNTRNHYEISFGKDILGREPQEGSYIEISYLIVENEHANGANDFTATSSIDDFTNIIFDNEVRAYGGADPETIEVTRLLAPKTYKMQNRALQGTDYVALIQRDFPFVRSAISWGGEENDPPRYGNVMVSLISEAGTLITTTAKSDIVNHLKDYNVGSVTPIILDPVRLDCDLAIKVRFDQTQTSNSFNGVTSEFESKLREFNDNSLNSFVSNLVMSDIIDIGYSVSGITQVSVETSLFRDVAVPQFANPIYDIRFNNTIVPNSISMTDFIVDTRGTHHKLYDDGHGKLFVSYAINETTTEMEVGTVDYEKGYVNFVLNTIGSDSLLVRCKPVDNDVYASRNFFININDTRYSQYSVR